MSFPDFNSTKQCRACGMFSFDRKYFGTYPYEDRIVVTCINCGWTTEEKMFCDSKKRKK